MDRVYTDLAVFDITPDGVLVRETFGTSYDELAERLDVRLRGDPRVVRPDGHGERRAAPAGSRPHGDGAPTPQALEG